MIFKAQHDVLREHAERFLLYRPKSPAESSLQETVKQLLSSTPLSCSSEKQMRLTWKLQNVFPSMLGASIAVFSINTIEDIRFLTSNLGLSRLEIVIDFSTYSLGDLGQLAAEFSIFADRVSRMCLSGSVPAEFAECVNLIEPLRLEIHSNSKQIDPKFIENLRRVKSIRIDCGEKGMHLVEAALKNPSIEVLTI